MFLNPALLRQDPVFADNGYGEFLAKPELKLADHALALRSAFNLSGDEYDRIVAALGYDATTPLTIPNVSAIYRRGWLARKLKLSVHELLLLSQLAGLGPFVTPDGDAHRPLTWGTGHVQLPTEPGLKAAVNGVAVSGRFIYALHYIYNPQQPHAFRAGTLFKIEGETRAIVAQVSVGHEPRSVAILEDPTDPTRRTLYVTNAGPGDAQGRLGTSVMIVPEDANGFGQVKEVKVSGGPHEIAVSPKQNRLLVTSPFGRRLHVLSAVDGSKISEFVVAEAEQGPHGHGPYMVAVDDDESAVYITVAPRGGSSTATRVVKLVPKDATTYRSAWNVPVAPTRSTPPRIAVDGERGLVYVSNNNQDPQGPNESRVTILSTENGTVLGNTREMGSLVHGLRVSERFGYAYSALGASVAVIGSGGSIVETIPTGLGAPWGIAVHPETQQVIVGDTLDGKLTIATPSTTAPPANIRHSSPRLDMLRAAGAGQADLGLLGADDGEPASHAPLSRRAPEGSRALLEGRLDPFDREILRLISFVQALKNSPLSTAAALYLVWNQDLSGKSAPDRTQVAAFARTLRTDLAAVEAEFAVADDPDGALARVRFAKVYGAEAADFFFGLLGDTLTVDVDFSDPEGTLAPGAARQAIEEAAGKTETGAAKISYDDFRKRLAYAGVLTAVTRDAIKASAGSRAAAFKAAVDELYSEHQATVGPFFERYPELRGPFDAYITDRARTAAQKRASLLQAILPGLIERRKRQVARQAASTVADIDPALAPALLDAPEAPFPLHATARADRPALRDLLEVQTAGLSVQFFIGDTATGVPVRGLTDIASNLDYSRPSGNPLPANPTAGGAVSGIWRGYIEAPESGFYNLRMEADAGARVTLLLDDEPVALAQDRTLWGNASPVQLEGGTLYPITLTVEKVRDVLRVQWEWDPKGQGRGVVPARYLYPAPAFASLADTYVRFLKAASLATGLGLTVNELAFFATHPDYRIGETGWLNHLSASGNPERATGTVLLNTLKELIDFVRIKAQVSPGDESLLTVLKDPVAATQTEEGLLFALTRWNTAGLNAVLAHFSTGIPDRNLIDNLRSFRLFRRAYDALALTQTMGIPAQALIKATTNEPAGETVRDLQAALRARYDAGDWRDVRQADQRRDARPAARRAGRLHPAPDARAPRQRAHRHARQALRVLPDGRADGAVHADLAHPARALVGAAVHRALPDEPGAARLARSRSTPKQWEWMKRYRVWEANRKVFLFPENWLEPELRDDKSPFFKETMSELLQGDITDERAAIALLELPVEAGRGRQARAVRHALRRGRPPGTADDVAHVVARTAGANRKYYYRAASTATGRPGSRSSWTSRTTRSSRWSGTIGCSCSGCASSSRNRMPGTSRSTTPMSSSPRSKLGHQYRATLVVGERGAVLERVLQREMAADPNVGRCQPDGSELLGMCSSPARTWNCTRCGKRRGR